MNDEELGREIARRAFPPYQGEIEYARAGAAARELLAEPQRADVPNYATIQVAMFSGIEGPLSASEQSIVISCSRIAHEMMQRQAPRQRMVIDGLDGEKLADIILNFAGLVDAAEHMDWDAASVEIQRLANTPAPEVDPVLEKAKEMAWTHWNARRVEISTIDTVWNYCSDDERKGWLALARKELGK